MDPWDATNLPFDAATFSGVVRLFPLPNLVLYPHVLQPLHVFEGRYREMVEDALTDDELIAMGVLEPGWESDYEGRPPVASHACLGKIITHRRLDDGRYNLLLLGVARVRLVHELDPLRSFRQAEVEVIEDHCDPAQHCENHRLQESLLEMLRRHMPCSCQPPEQLDELVSQHLSLGLLTDLAAYSLPLDLDVKQQLLAECRVDVRARRLLREIETLAEITSAGLGSEYPPPFSSN